MFIQLNEDSRTKLVARSKQGKREKDGKTRYEKRLKSHVGTSTQQYNRINMNQLFKNGIVSISVEVKGETDDYLVTISYGGFLDALRDLMKRHNEELDLRIIIKSLIIAFNKEDVYIRCTCPDFYYRFGYWATKNNIISGDVQLIPSDETNPNDDLGPACKHVLLVLSNTSWLIKVASVINNYIKYMERNRRTQYDAIIFPAIYGKKTNVQTSFIDSEDEVADNTSEINAQGSKLGRGRKPIANPSIRKIRERDSKPLDGQMSIDDLDTNGEEL